MKLKDLIFEQENQVAAAAKAINNAITSIDDSMHYGVFAKAVAHILRDEYGSHNIEPFMKELHAALGMNEQSQEEDLKSKLSQELEANFGEYNPIVSVFGNFGVIRFRYQDELPEDKWKQAEEILNSHNLTITNSSNFYDTDDDRTWYPDLKFKVS